MDEIFDGEGGGAVALQSHAVLGAAAAVNASWPPPGAAAASTTSSGEGPEDVLILTGLELRHSLPVSVFFCVAYTVVFVLGVTGNALVVLVVARTPRMRSPTNLFIANLACADLLVNVLCLPFTLVGNLLSAWIMGWLICKTVPYLQGVSVSASINTLVAISVERCLAICYPLRWQVTSRTCRRTVAVIWIFSLTITLPWAVVFGLAPLQEGSSVHVCTELWPSALSENVYFALAHLLMCYLFPLALISACYLLIWRRVCRRTPPGERCAPANRAPPSGVDVMIHRSKVKVVKMLLAVVVTFALSWLPLYALFARVKFGGPPHSAGEEALIHAVLPVAQWLGASNSCVNPVFYTAFNRKFRAAFRAILTSRSCCGPLRYDDSFATSSARSSVHSKLARGITMGGSRGPSTATSTKSKTSGSVVHRRAEGVVTAPTSSRSVNALLSMSVSTMVAPSQTPRRLSSSSSLHGACVTKTLLPSARTVHNFVALANGAAGEGRRCIVSTVTTRSATSVTDIRANGSVKATEV